jgi:hypothetical protein
MQRFIERPTVGFGERGEEKRDKEKKLVCAGKKRIK